MIATPLGELKIWAAPLKTLRITKLAVIAAAAAATIAFPATADADSDGFQSPSENIVCDLGAIVNGPNRVVCEVANHTWVAPPRRSSCHMNWGDRLSLNQGSAADFECYHQPMMQPSETLNYDQTRSVGAITCGSELAGITCTDSTTGHYFKVSRESYQLG